MSKAPRLSLPHMLLALAIVLVWGTNFTIAKLGLRDFPPLFFTALRFFFAAIPAIFLLPRPAISWRLLAGYGLAVGAVQFGFLYVAMAGSISPGLASLVIQAQVFITIGLSMAFSGERVQPVQWVALLLAAAGLAIIIIHGGQDATLGGVLLVLVAASGWAVGNQVVRISGSVNMLGYVAWSSLFAVPPLVLAALLHDGWPAIAHSVVQAHWSSWAVVLWQSLGNTIFGYGCWSFLLARYPAATIAPTSLLVPVFGFTTSALVLGEALPGWKLGAGALVMAGLALNLIWQRRG